MSNARYAVISADGHVGPPDDVLRTFFAPQHREAFDAYAGERGGRKDALIETFGKMMGDDSALFQHPAMQPGGHPALWDPELRMKELDAEGVAGEILFPDFPHIISREPPFGLTTGGHKEADGGALRRSDELHPPELQWAGAQAYNRWLAEFCGAAPERFAGIALVPFLDVDAAVAEIHWAREHGLRGGILLPGLNRTFRYNDPAFEPIWATLSELDMPLNTHGGNEVPDYGEGLDAMILQMQETEFFAHRPLWWFVWSGILERHPELKLVFTEQMADWVPSTLAGMDQLFERHPMSRAAVARPPSEYWARQCYVGTFVTKTESSDRHAIGVDRIMWGSDYPHPEGTWPNTRQMLRYIYADVPSAETETMLGGTAARVYGFDLATLRPLIDRIGPTASEIAEPLEKPPVTMFG